MNMTISSRSNVAAFRRPAMTSTERTQSARRRKKEDLTLVKLGMFKKELDALVRHGLLRAGERQDPDAIKGAMYGLLPAAFQALDNGTLRVNASTPKTLPPVSAS
jgi:hypothetical protein